MGLLSGSRASSKLTAAHLADNNVKKSMTTCMANEGSSAGDAAHCGQDLLDRCVLLRVRTKKCLQHLLHTSQMLFKAQFPLAFEYKRGRGKL